MNLTIHEYGQQSNPMILFLHGLGVSSWMWHEQAEALQDRYYCVAVDLPGSGESYQEEWRSFEETAVILANIIRENGINGQAHVVGLSLGGYSALQLLSSHPETVLSMIVSGVTVRPFPNQWLYRAMLPVMSRATGWNIMIGLMAKMMQLPDEVKPLYRRDSKRLDPQGIKRIYDEVFDFGLLAGLDERPLLAVAGEKEAKLVLESLPDFNRISSAVTAIAPNAHHGWNGEFPELYTAMITAWIEKRPLPDSLVIKSGAKSMPGIETSVPA